jgi:pSer/pThr/pTyr-binding forkhead associated (FHA) protein
MQLEFGGRWYPVAAGDVVIGSGSESTLVLAAPGVLPRHAVIRPLGPGMAVVVPAMPGAEILVNGARLGSDPTPLMHGDKIRIGGCEITVADPRRAGATQVLATAQPASTPDPSSPTTHDASPGTSATPAGRLVSLTDGREYSLDAVPFVIGRDATAGVVVEAEEVSRRHAEILTVPEGDCLVDLSSNGVWVNGERIRGKTMLKSGDVIRVAREELRYYPSEARTPAAGANFRLGDTIVGFQAVRRAPIIQSAYLAPSEPPLASLLIKGGQRKGDRIGVRTPVVNIGRADYNDVSLPDPSVSASHAKLQLREGVWMLADLGSTNGTRVDGEPVRGESPLSPGSTVTFGEVPVSFEPRDSGVAKGSGTQVLQVPLAASAPVGPGPQGSVLGGARRQPIPAPAANRVPLILLGVGSVLLLLAYFLLG